MAVPAVAISLTLLAIGIGAAWYFHVQDANFSLLLKRLTAENQAGVEVANKLTGIRRQLTLYRRHDETHSLKSIQQLDEEFWQWLSQAEQLSSSDEQRTWVLQTREAYQPASAELRVAWQSPESEPISDGRIELLISDVISGRALPAAENYRQSSQRAVLQASEENIVITGRVTIGLVVLGLCGALAGLLIGYVMSRVVSRSVVQLNLPIRDAAGKLAEVIGPVSLRGVDRLDDVKPALHDLADQIGKVVIRLQKSQRDALRAEQLAALGQLAAGMAHELRNPLTSIKLLVQSAAEQGASGVLEGRDLIILEQEIVRLERAIQLFLDFARPAKLQKQRFDLREVIENTVELVSKRAARQHVKLICQLSDRPLLIEADAEQIRQVTLNLLINSLDVLPGGGTIDITVDLPDNPRDAHTGDISATVRRVLLQICDNGPGLPDSLVERIFEPFVSTKETGLGLGLSICRRIVEDHGGTIGAGNRAGGGAEFHVELPLAESSALLPAIESLKPTTQGIHAV